MKSSRSAPDRAIRTQTNALLVMVVLAVIGFAGIKLPYITYYQLVNQDLVAAALLVVAGIALRGRLASLARVRLGTASVKPGVTLWVAAIALAVVAFGVLGELVLFHGYSLSMDEYWARADGVIFATGKPMAQVPQEWRAFAPALEPTFARILPDSGYWSSTYLPVNALIQHLLGPLASPLMAGLSIIVAADLARQLLPGKRAAPLICALVLASSSQLLVTAMTPYAMNGHLFFNLVWLWLFLRREALAQGAAMVVAVLAIGLHQAAFFPLFAAPFLFEALLAHRRRLALAHFVVIAAGFLAWSHWDVICYSILHVAPPKAPAGSARLLDMLFARVLGSGLKSVGLMGLNLFRFQLWQNPVVVPLILMVAMPVLRMPGRWRAMLGGIVLTTLFVLVVFPFQGHGWGYRYLHGLLGSASLLSTLAFYKLMPDDAPDHEARQWRAYVLAMTAFALVILVPLHVFQAWKQAQPYVSANAALAGWKADVVVIDAPQHAYASDLTRNDPLLRNRPKRMDYDKLAPGQLAALCSRYSVRLFGNADAARFGIPDWAAESGAPRVYPAQCHFDSVRPDK
ncbi:MAG: hypothetical protein KGL48_05905 [Sphingomonadales bacterium]|nr:hypothetical protein [Sphingomonadales bacterium]MDE2569961.1 hypothetical protein [Sphingomonadales bacterium]